MYNSSIDADLARHKAIHAALDLYRSKGLATCRIPPGHKNPISRKWSTVSVDDPDIYAADDNVGILCGTISAPDGSALVCPDLDSLQAVGLADEHLPPTAMIEGRAGKPHSHRYYRVPVGTIPADEVAEGSDAALANVEAGRHPGPKKRAWRRPDGTLLLELLGTGQQAQAPPSMHPSGEVREWDGGQMGEPAVISWSDLVAACERLAVACGWTPPPPRPDRADLPDWGDGHEIDTPADERVRRAAAYLEKVPGTRAGRSARTSTFGLAGRVLHGFGLDPEQAVEVLTAWGQRPDHTDATGGWYPWDRDEIERFVADQERKGDWQDRPAGYLLIDHDPEWEAEPPADSPAGRIRARSLGRPAAVEVEPAEGVEAEPQAQPAQPLAKETKHTQEKTMKTKKAKAAECRNGFAAVANWFLGDTAPVVFHAGQVLAYAGTHYEEWDRERLALTVRRWSILRDAEMKSREVSEVCQSLLAQRMTGTNDPVPFWLGDGPPAGRIIPFRNGLLDLATWEMIPHTPDFVCEWSLPYDYDPQATCREWVATLNAVYEGDADRVGLLQEWCGYLMSGDTRQHKMLGLCGVQRSLKSTILMMMRLLVGERNTAACRLASLGSRFGLQPLVGKPLAIISEVEDAANSAQIVETVKALTGGDSTDIDRKGLPPLTSVRLPTRLVFASNKLPMLFDSTAALAERLLLLEHRRSWLGREDRDLPERLAAEVEGVAVWALAGLRRLRERGKFGAVQSDTLRRFRRASASVDAFLSDCCEVYAQFAPAHIPLRTTADPEVSADKLGLFNAYAEYCERWAVYPKTEKGFHCDLAELIPALPANTFRPHGKPRRYRGLQVVGEQDPGLIH